MDRQIFNIKLLGNGDIQFKTGRTETPYNRVLSLNPKEVEFYKTYIEEHNRIMKKLDEENLISAFYDVFFLNKRHCVAFVKSL